MVLGVKRGLFPWYTLQSTDPEKATLFYQNLFDWKLNEMVGDSGDKSVIFSHALGPFCDLSFLPPPQQQRSCWLSYIAVENVEKNLHLIERYGGRVLKQAFDIPGAGRTAVVADPSGALFMPFTCSDPRALPCVLGTTPGSICWNELTTDDLDTARSFYSKIAGWEFSRHPHSADSFDFSSNGRRLGHIRKVSPVSGLQPASWMIFIATNDLQKSLRTTELLGGRHHTGAITMPDFGSFALIEDPTGALSYLLQREFPGDSIG